MIANHVARNFGTPVRPTSRMVMHWWRRMNQEFFGGALIPPVIAVHKARWQNVYGLCWPLPGGRVKIQIDPDYNTTRGDMLSTLAHEMIHQWQHQHGEPLTHGPTFKAWVSLIAENTGLTP
jgi:hypothetical protein